MICISKPLPLLDFLYHPGMKKLMKINFYKLTLNSGYIKCQTSCFENSKLYPIFEISSLKLLSEGRRVRLKVICVPLGVSLYLLLLACCPPCAEHICFLL